MNEIKKLFPFVQNSSIKRRIHSVGKKVDKKEGFAHTDNTEKNEFIHKYFVVDFPSLWFFHIRYTQRITTMENGRLRINVGLCQTLGEMVCPYLKIIIETNTDVKEKKYIFALGFILYIHVYHKHTNKTVATIQLAIMHAVKTDALCQDIFVICKNPFIITCKKEYPISLRST